MRLNIYHTERGTGQSNRCLGRNFGCHKKIPSHPNPPPRPSPPETGNSAEQHGGAVKADSAAAVSVTDTIFLENTATGSTFDTDAGQGGAIYLAGGTPQLEFHGCELRSNNASGTGGAVFYEAGGGITVNDTRLEANGARYSGGAIYAGGDISEVCTCVRVCVCACACARV